MLPPKTTLLGSLAWLAASSHVRAQSIIMDDTYFYGQSPPVYPAREC
jgi:hypothetical protein